MFWFDIFAMAAEYQENDSTNIILYYYHYITLTWRHIIPRETRHTLLGYSVDDNSEGKETFLIRSDNWAMFLNRIGRRGETSVPIEEPCERVLANKQGCWRSKYRRRKLLPGSAFWSPESRRLYDRLSEMIHVGSLFSSFQTYPPPSPRPCHGNLPVFIK